MSTAINIFLKTTIREHGIPFDLKSDYPKATTIVAIEEGEKIATDSNTPGYTNIEDLKKL